MMSEQEVRLYANEADFSEGLKEMLAKAGVALYPYNQVYTDAAAIESQKTVLVDKGKANYRLVKSIPASANVLDHANLPAEIRAARPPHRSPVSANNDSSLHARHRKRSDQS